MPDEDHTNDDTPEQTPSADAGGAQAEAADQADVDPNNPVAKRLREMREQKARMAAEEEARSEAPVDEDSAETEAAAQEPDPDLIASIMDAFVFPFRENAYLKLLWLSFCFIAAPFAVMQMESPFGFTLVTLLFMVPIAINCRSRVMMFALAIYIFASLFVFTGMVKNPNVIGWFVLLISWFFLTYSMSFLYRVLQEGTQNRKSMGPLPGYGGSDVVEEIIKPGSFLMIAVVCSYIPYLIYAFNAYNLGSTMGRMSDLGAPFAIMSFAGEILLYLSGPLEDTFFGWLLYIACWVYSLLAISLVARLDNLMAMLPKVWLVSFFTIMGPYLGVMIFELVFNKLVGWGAQQMGGFFGFGDGIFVLFLKSWLIIFASIYIAVVMTRCLGVLIASQREALTNAFKKLDM